MPRRNRQLLLLTVLLSLLCHERASHAQRDRYGRMVIQALGEVEHHYLERTDPEQLFEGAMQGLMNRLDDYSEYVNEGAFTDLKQSLDQQFGGVGIQLSLDEETRDLTVISPLLGTPAFDAGVRAQDRILRINGESTEGFRLDDAMRRLRGRPGDAVQITILHPGEDEPVEMTLVRAVIHTETVQGDSREPDGQWNFLLPDFDRLGYVRIGPMFSERTSQELTDAVVWLQERDARGMILDLRNNPGGLLQAAVEVCSVFASEGVIVSTRGRTGETIEQFPATGGAAAPTLPLVLLVNQYSASASEIVSACLQDFGRAKIVGKRTFGKGSVQELIRLGDGQRALRLTTASYWRPSGKNIHRTKKSQASDAWGVLPDPEGAVDLDGDDLERALRTRRQRDVLRPAGELPTAADLLAVDPQLQRAIEVLQAAIDGVEVEPESIESRETAPAAVAP